MASVVTNIINGIGKNVGRVAGNPYKELSIGWFDLRMLKNSPKQDHYKQRFLNGFITFNSVPEFLYGINEIFVDHIYRFQAKNDRPVILDCGGHIGLSAIYFKRQHPNALVTVFEPDAGNFEFLKTNLASQGYGDVVLRNEAIWIENKMLTFNSEASMSSKIATDNETDGLMVKAVRLKDQLITEIDLLKLDIEGAEYEVLKDIKDKLHLLRNIFIEYHGLFAQQGELMQILQWVSEAGFTFYIKEAHNVYPQPFSRQQNDKSSYDVQLNIFCFRN
ncbi:FkbM family methyltransferase [Niabella hibiscisoli]|uniref:FkbM family methyltransferase n=1 Tax=Niabella hibiscisoli TaxID=1825928 RepID=UPI001F108ED5|nr:FkbM family methyltransferase [Niabella hibiscisoli]MCH5717223.1 FkbM family methyltransferase [Niabella hibiscisoli]